MTRVVETNSAGYPLISRMLRVECPPGYVGEAILIHYHGGIWRVEQEDVKDLIRELLHFA